MTKRNILKIALITTVATFTVLNHNKAIQHQNELRLQKANNFTYKTEKQRYDEIYKMWVKPSQEKTLAEKKKQEELDRKRKEESEWIIAICTAYSSDPSENGNSTGKTASGHKLSRGVCAIPYELKLGTRLYIQGIGEVIGNDRGNSNYIYFDKNENIIRIDIFMNSKEEAMKFGVRRLKCKIIK